MVTIIREIDKIINAPKKQMTKSEANEILRKCGVLTNNNKIRKAYQDIIVEIHKNGKRTI